MPESRYRWMTYTNPNLVAANWWQCLPTADELKDTMKQIKSEQTLNRKLAKYLSRNPSATSIRWRIMFFRLFFAGRCLIHICCIYQIQMFSVASSMNQHKTNFCTCTAQLRLYQLSLFIVFNTIYSFCFGFIQMSCKTKRKNCFRLCSMEFKIRAWISVTCFTRLMFFPLLLSVFFSSFKRMQIFSSEIFVTKFRILWLIYLCDNQKQTE